MRVRVLFFGILKDLSGKSSDFLELREGASVADLLRHCAGEVAALQASSRSLAVAVNQQYARPETLLKDGDEVALLPPVSGGSGALTSAHCSITHEAIQSAEVLQNLKRGEDGAAVLFEGIVRNHTRGRKTLYLDYEAYDEMALKQMEELAAQALVDYGIRDVAMVHRLGRLEIGQTSVLIAVASAHRGPAFEACRWLIDTLKRTVPIWKKEYFEDGAVWADGEAFPEDVARAKDTGSPAGGAASK